MIRRAPAALVHAATGLARPRQSLLDECRVTLRLWPNDLDSNLHMSNSRYLLAIDLGRFGQRVLRRHERQPRRHAEALDGWRASRSIARAISEAPGSSVPSLSP